MRVLCLASVLVVVLLAAAVSPHALSSPPTLSSRSTSGLPVHASLHLERTWHVQFTVSNPSRDQPVSILRWFTPLEQVLATRDLFEVSELADNGVATPLPYVGKLAKRNDALAAAEHFVTLEAGSSYSQVVDLSHGYVFEAGKRYVVRVSGKASMLVTADGVSARVKLTDVLAAGKVVATAPALEFRADSTTVLPQLRRKDRKKRSPTAVTSPAWEVAYSENNCAGHTSFNTQAVAAVRAGLVDAVAYTDSSCEDAQYTEWFGTVTTTRYTRVKEICAMSKTILDSSAFTIYCNPPDCDSGTFAYVYPSDPSLTIHVCGAYFSAPLDLRTNSAPGTLFHEASHFNHQGTSGTDDHVYGPTGARSLAQSNPNNAVDNADSFEYFLEQGLDLSGCGAGSGTGSSGDGSSGASEDPIDGPLSTSVGFFDACAEQQITTGGAICSGTSTFDMTGFAASGSYVGDCSTTATSPDGFLRFIAPATGTLTLETLDSTMDTVLMIIEGCEASAVACNDDSVGTLSKLSFGVTEGTLYSIRVATWNGGAASTFTLAHSMNVPCAASTPSATGTGEAGSGGTDATPTATGDDEPTPSATGDDEPTPSATGDDEPTPSATGDNEPTPSATGDNEPTPSATGDDEPTPSATADSGSTPTPSATADSDSPSATADAGDNPTPTGTAAGDTDLTGPPGNDTDASSSSTSSFESIGIYVGAGVIVLVVILIWLRRRRRKEDDKSPASSSQSSLALNPMTTQSSAAVGAAPWAQRQIEAHRQSFTGELPHQHQQQQQQHYPQQQYYTQQQQQQQQQQHYPQQQYYTQQQQQQQHHHYPQQHNPAEPPLPPGWQMLHDQNGVPYYYRAAAPGVPGVTQWTRPLG